MDVANDYDVVVIGGGPGGYTAAIRASQLGKKVALIEKSRLGGTCLHQGCIPSKSLLKSAELYATMKRSREYGLIADSVSVDYPLVQQRKRQIIEQLFTGLQFLMKKHRIQILPGTAQLKSAASEEVTVEVTGEASELPMTITAGYAVVATGSRPRVLPGLEPDDQRILTSDEALELETLPSSMVILGGGVIGVEWASMLSDFGVEVTLLEGAPQLLPSEDEAVARELRRLLAKRGVTIITGGQVIPSSLTVDESSVALQIERAGELSEVRGERLLVCVGRQANVEGLGLEHAGISTERDGLIQVDGYGRTAHPCVYAVGDITPGPQLAHKASHDGMRAAEHLCGGVSPEPHKAHLIPRCIYSRPEIASVGWTEQQAKEQGVDVEVSKVSFKSNGKALVLGAADGFVKLVSDKQSRELVGVHMIGPQVTDHISAGTLAQLVPGGLGLLTSMVHPHPTLSEMLGEAAHVLDGSGMV